MAPAEVYVISEEATQRSLAVLLTAGGLAFRTFGNGADFLRDCHDLPRGCVVASLRMPDMGGLELLRQLRHEGVSYPTIIVAEDTDIPQAVAAMQAGAVNFIEAPFRDEDMLWAVRTALQSGSQPRSPARPRLSHTSLATLTRREHDVLIGVVDGKTNKVIARDCGISPRTVEVHRANVMAKSGARSVSELVRMAVLADHPGALKTSPAASLVPS